MFQKETLRPQERGQVINHICTSAVDMVAQRLIIEQAGLPLINLPFCPDVEADLIESFLPRAKDGFALNLEASALHLNELSKLHAETTPLTLQGIWHQLALQEKDNTLPEWGHVLATFAYLSHLGRVTFNDFHYVPRNIGHTSDKLETFWWTNELSPETIWFKMIEMEQLTRETLYEPTNIGEIKLAKLGHFFAAGKEISRIFDPEQL